MRVATFVTPFLLSTFLRALQLKIYLSRFPCAIVFFVSLALFAGSLHAQVDAGSLQQQVDRERQFLLPRLLPRPEAERAMKQPSSSGPKLIVRKFKFVGNSFIPTAEIEPLVALYLNRPLSFSELEDVAARIAAHYRDAGWTVRVFLPEQNVVDGVVTVQVIEAVLGSVRSEGPVPGPSSLESIRQIIESSQPSGQFMGTKRIDRGLLIANDISGVYVSGNLVEGEKDGQTDILLKTLEKPVLEGSASYENTGSYATGANRALVMIGVNNFSQPGGILSSQLAHTKGSQYGRLAVSIPVGLQGVRFDLSASRLDYEVVNLPKELAANGISTTTGLNMSYPLMRSRAQNIYLNSSFDQKKFTNYALGNLSSKYSSRTFSLSISGNRESEVLGQAGTTALNFGVVRGILNMAGSPNEETLLGDSNPAGNFSKIRFSVSQEQSLGDAVSAFISFSGQWADRNLDSSEKFTLGGTAGLRAYGSGEASGAIGQMGNIELRWRFIPAVVLAGFYDIGSVRTNVDNDYRGAPTLNRYSLKGGGISANWSLDKNMSVRASWARRTGRNPNANIETGKDQDGSLVLNRVWLSASVSF